MVLVVQVSCLSLFFIYIRRFKSFHAGSGLSQKENARGGIRLFPMWSLLKSGGRTKKPKSRVCHMLALTATFACFCYDYKTD